MAIRLTLNESNYAPFTAVTGTLTYCPNAVLYNRRSTSNNETVKLFVSEMEKIGFSAHAVGRVHMVPSYVTGHIFSRQTQVFWVLWGKTRGGHSGA